MQLKRNCLLGDAYAKKGLSQKMVKLLKRMYESVLCCVKSGQHYTEFFGSPTGAKQGCLLSPDSFCSFISEVVDEIRKGGKHDIMLSNVVIEI